MHWKDFKEEEEMHLCKFFQLIFSFINHYLVKMFRKQKKQQEASKAQRCFKFLFVGSRRSDATTSFIEAFSHLKGNPVYKEMLVLQTSLVLELWDSPEVSVDDADCIVACYDVTDRDSYNEALYGCEAIFKRNPSALKAVIGSKIDMFDDRKVSVGEGRVLADFVEAQAYYEGSTYIYVCCSYFVTLCFF